MPKMNVQRSVKINAPASKVYEAVKDLKHWKAWSPWLIMEPEAKVTVSENGAHYSWEGKRVGSGNMSVTDSRENKQVDYDLTFLKPWKSTSKVRFELQENGQGTHVTWFMFSSLPFFMFWMKGMMESFIGMDYQRGLMLLKDYVEDGKVHSKLTFSGSGKYPGSKYIGITTTCSMEELSTKMSSDFTLLDKLFQNHKDLPTGKPISIYHKWDLVKNKVIYTSAIPVKSTEINLNKPFVTGQIPATPVYTLQHTGPYAHLGNAWSTLFNMARSKEFRQNKKIDPFEVYENMPGAVPDNELVTSIYFPSKE
jgi:uncharacterized protein YndB with AHSA1/START domain/predicted transcriptional regulator YdeE